MKSLRSAMLAAGLIAAGCTPSSTRTAPSAPAAPSAPSPSKSSTNAGSAKSPRHVTFLHVADSHAQLETHPEYMPGQTPELQTMGGYARLKTAIERERAVSKGAVFVADGGDTFQGSGPAAWSEGEVVLGPLNALGLDICVPGNWEVVYGPSRFRDLMKRVSCKVTTYNFHDAKTGERLFAPEVTLERDGVRVTFVGITDPTTTKRQPPDEVVGLDSTRMDGLRDFVKSLRASERADLVVAVTHTGLSLSRQIARSCPATCGKRKWRILPIEKFARTAACQRPRRNAPWERLSARASRDLGS